MKKGVIFFFFFQLTLLVGAQQFASELQMSTENEAYWYRISNASFGMQDYVMTDCYSLDNDYQVQLLQTEVNDEYSQWKLLAVGNNDKVVLINRATGLQLGGKSVNLGDHNVAKLDVNSSIGFTITALGDDAFSLCGVEDDGVERCLALAEKDTPALLWPEENLSASVIGWKFMPVEPSKNGIFETKTKSDIYVTNRSIFVSGCSSWQLFSLNGKEIPTNKNLLVGVYLVKTPDRVFKVIVP